MTDTPSRRRSRMTRTERAKHLYTARTDEYTADAAQQAEPVALDYEPNELNAYSEVYQSNETEDNFSAYQPNEPQHTWDGYTPNESFEQPKVDYSAYYSREGAEQEESEPAFAPPPSMQQYVCEWQDQETEQPDQAEEYAGNHVYRPRQVTWADEDREDAIAAGESGYLVQQEEKIVRKRRHPLRNVLIVLLVLSLLGAGIWFFREPIAEKLGIVSLVPAATEEPPAVVITPEPIKAYDAAPAASMADSARHTIARLSGSLVMENYIVTEDHVVTRNLRKDNRYDFYLFTSEGRLLCYFEGLGPLDLIPQEHGGFYVNQSPWLVMPNGSAMIRTSNVEAAIGEDVFLHPMYHGWAVVESEEDGNANYINANGQVMSTLWFSRTFPFTGDRTLAYVDTGSVGSADRYLLYVLDTDGSMTRWLSGSDMEDVLTAVCGMACMNDGKIYRLTDTAAPICQSNEITIYLDCNAMVVKDPASGKYGLFVHGEQHYDFVYDAIRPLESDLNWAEKVIHSETVSLTLKAVEGAEYPQPLSHSFVLEKDGHNEYVALSTSSSYPIRLDGEF